MVRHFKHLFVIGLFSLSAILNGQQITEYSVVVEGFASVEQVPEMIVFTINFSKENEDYNACVNQTLLTISEVKNDLQKLKIDANLLKTSSFNVNPEYDWDNDTRKQIFKGYRATQNMELKIKFQPDIADKLFYAFNERLKSIYTVSFDLSDNQRKVQQNKLLDLAVMDATEKANQIATSSKIKLGRISGIKYATNVPENNIPTPMLSKVALDIAGSIPMVAGSLTPQPIKISTSILMIWDIEEPVDESENGKLKD